MMDFLRRLAPARETDGTRALAVLPSRFLGQHPLQGNLDQARSAQRPDDDDFSRLPPTGLPPVASPVAAAQVHASVSVQPAQASPIRLLSETGRRENEQAMTPAHAFEKASGAPEMPSPRAVQHRTGDSAGRSSSPSPQAMSPAATVPAAMPALEDASAPPAQQHDAWPLSPASLAQRASQPQGGGQVVHVTIGRIEVVAHTAAAPAPPRSPAPRQPSVTLADYLRGGQKGRP